MTENNDFKNLVHNLDYELGSISMNVETIKGVSSELARVRGDMDVVDMSADVRFYFMECHTMIRILDDLLSYATKDLNSNYQSVNETKNKLFGIVVKD